MQCAIEPLSTFTNPPDPSGRDTSHQGIIFYIAGNYGAGRDQGAAANGMAADDGGVGADRSAFPNQRPDVLAVGWKVRPRRIHIGKDAGRTAEHVVLQLNAFVNGDIVLNADPVPDPDAGSHIHILPQRTIPADDSPRLDVAKVPDPGTCANLGTFIDITALVYEVVHLRYSWMAVIITHRLSSFSL